MGKWCHNIVAVNNPSVERLTDGQIEFSHVVRPKLLTKVIKATIPTLRLRVYKHWISWRIYSYDRYSGEYAYVFVPASDLPLVKIYAKILIVKFPEERTRF